MRVSILIGMAVLAILGISLGIVALAAKSRPYATVSYRNTTDMDVWISPPLNVDGLDTFEAARIAAGGGGGFFRDHVRSGDTFEILAFGSDPGRVRPSTSTTASPGAWVARATVSGERLLRTRSEGPLEFVLANVRGKVVLRVVGDSRRVAGTGWHGSDGSCRPVLSDGAAVYTPGVSQRSSGGWRGSKRDDHAPEAPRSPTP